MRTASALVFSLFSRFAEAGLFRRPVHLHDAKNVLFCVRAVGEITLTCDRHFWYHDVSAGVDDLFRKVVDRGHAECVHRACRFRGTRTEDSGSCQESDRQFAACILESTRLDDIAWAT